MSLSLDNGLLRTTIDLLAELDSFTENNNYQY